MLFQIQILLATNELVLGSSGGRKQVDAARVSRLADLCEDDRQDLGESLGLAEQEVLQRRRLDVFV